MCKQLTALYMYYVVGTLPTLQPYCFTDIVSIMPNCDIDFGHFVHLTRGDLMKIISAIATCISKPFPTQLLMSHFPAIDVILDIIDLCLESVVSPLSCKSSVIIYL